MGRVRVGVVAIALMVTLSHSAFAQRRKKPASPPPPVPAAPAVDPNAAQAATLKDRADAAFDAKKYQEALTLYDQSYALVPNVAIFYNRGRVYGYLGQYPRAQEELEHFASDAPPDLKAKVPGFDAILADVKSHVATVHVNCAVSGAHVLVGSMDVGVTPLADVKVNAGPARVDVLADGYYPFHKSIVLAGGQTTPIDVGLSSRDRHGLLVVKSSLRGTSVAIDGSDIGIAPTESTLEQGTHGVRVSHDGYSDSSTSIFVNAGERKELELSPQTKPSIFSRWWFWTITGAVVVAGATTITIVAVTTEKSPQNGDFSPGAVHF